MPPSLLHRCHSASSRVAPSDSRLPTCNSHPCSYLPLLSSSLRSCGTLSAGDGALDSIHRCSSSGGRARDFTQRDALLVLGTGAQRGFGAKGRHRWQTISSAAAESSNFGDGAAAEADPQALQQQEKTMSMLQLGTYFSLWYLYNVIFNVYNKKALNVFPFPWLLASVQLFAGALWMLGLWGLKLQPCPPVSKEFLTALAMPAFFHTVGHISACVSFSKVAVSFTHIIKSAEPVFSVIFSSFLGQTYPILVWLSILPIVFGCSLAAVTEVSFNFVGLWGAMISNVGFVLRNIYSKKRLKDFKQFDGINLYGWITILSLAYLVPVSIIVEGSQWVAGYKEAIAAVGQASTFHLWVLLSGVFYHLYNQSSYQALDGISPLTFSVGNTMKRVVVIIATVLIFRNPIRPLNALGSAIAILGTFLYSQATQNAMEKKQV